MTGREQGFSLVEALVAMAILAIVAVALLRTTGSHVSRTEGLGSRAFALLVAQNRAAELRLPASEADALPEVVEMMNRRWRVSTVFAPTEDPELTEAIISVRELGGFGPVSRLSTFVDRGAAP